MSGDFARLARQERPGLARLLLSAAAEFRDVDRTRSRVTLDQMAARLWSWTEQDEMTPARAVARLLDEHGFRAADRVSPEDAMLDSVLLRGEGHPAIISSICVEAGLRAGLPMGVAAGGGEILIGVRPGRNTEADGDVELIDPTGRLQDLEPPLNWRCSHEVAFVVLSELSRLYCLTGDIPRAMHAAQIRAELPIGAKLRSQLAFEVGALRAMLN